MTHTAVLETELGTCPARRGKVRDLYDLGSTLLIVATDRISAFDWVLPTGIPDKGRVLTQLSVFWFRLLDDQLTDLNSIAETSGMARFKGPNRNEREHRSHSARRGHAGSAVLRRWQARQVPLLEDPAARGSRHCPLVGRDGGPRGCRPSAA